MTFYYCDDGDVSYTEEARKKHLCDVLSVCAAKWEKKKLAKLENVCIQCTALISQFFSSSFGIEFE